MILHLQKYNWNLEGLCCWGEHWNLLIAALENVCSFSYGKTV